MMPSKCGVQLEYNIVPRVRVIKSTGKTRNSPHKKFMTSFLDTPRCNYLQSTIFLFNSKLNSGH